MPLPITSDGKSTLGKSFSITRVMWDKIVSQTFNQIPALFLRFYKDESLRQTDLDLVVLEAQTFSEILEDARKWREVAEGFAAMNQDPCLRRKMVTEALDPGCDCCR